MRLRGIEFGNVLAASGVQNFFGEGYWFHKILRPDFGGVTFVSKTATFMPRKGNMPLTRNYQPKEFFPKCVKVRPFRGLMLNSVGLSNPGIGKLINTGKWQELEEPFFISIASVADSREMRIEEINRIVDIIGSEKDEFHALFGLQINLSCPNTGHNPSEIIDESEHVLEIASQLGIPLMPKYSIASAPIRAILELGQNPNCNAICVSNTIPFGSENFDWWQVWGNKTSPLKKYGGGGLSGKALLPFVCEWIYRLRELGFTKPINGGGGILCPRGVEMYHMAGASSVFIGSVAVLRPWRVRPIVNKTNSLNWR